MRADRVQPGRRASRIRCVGVVGTLALLAMCLAACASAGTNSRTSGAKVSGSDQSLPFTGPTGPSGNTGAPNPPGGTETAAEKCQQAARQAQRQLSFPPKAKMTVAQTTTVEIQLAAAGQTLPAQLGATTTIIPASTTCDVEATLDGGPQLSINPQDPAKQDFDEGPVLSWSWLVTPNASGTYELRLDVQSVQPNGFPVTLDKKDVAIDAVVSPESAPARVGHFINSPLGLTLLGTLLAFALGLAVTFFTGRHKTRSSS